MIIINQLPIKQSMYAAMNLLQEKIHSVNNYNYLKSLTSHNLSQDVLCRLWCICFSLPYLTLMKLRKLNIVYTVTVWRLLSDFVCQWGPAHMACLLMGLQILPVFNSYL